MEYTKEICKVTDNQIVFPINGSENIGDALSSINYNFRALDVYTTNFEYSASNIWNAVYNDFASSSADWANALNIFRTNSACWEATCSTVQQLSGQWLKPISLVYPYPLDINGDESDIINSVTYWLNQAFPVTQGNCINFIVGQEFYVFVPQYTQINKVISQNINLGVKPITVSYSFFDIKRGYRTIKSAVPTDLGTIPIDVSTTDQYVSKFGGLRFIVDPASLTWVYNTTLYS